MKRPILLTFALCLLSYFAVLAQQATDHIYVVVINGGMNKLMNHERYWNDCALIQTMAWRRGARPIALLSVCRWASASIFNTNYFARKRINIIFAKQNERTMLMRRVLFFAWLLTCSLLASAQNVGRPMLEQGKTWYYTYHHYEAKGPYSDEDMREQYDITTFPVAYMLWGDTVINGRQYMKMYRYREYDDENMSYYAAFREEEGKVYVYVDGYYGYNEGHGDMLLIDFSMGYDDSFAKKLTVDADTIKTWDQFFHRYSYWSQHPNGVDRRKEFVGVEGVGFKDDGLINYILGPEPDCICDYQTFDFVEGKGWMFTNADFDRPKEIQLSDAERAFVTGNNDFAFRLFREARDEGSMLLSPLSITYALGMLNNGAGGQTQQEICNVLGSVDVGSLDVINTFCRRMLTESARLDPETRSLIANTIYVNEGRGYRLQDGFVQLANDYYDATPQARDFADGETMDVINQWASDHTMGMIEKLLDEDSFDPLAVSYLLNAIYFKGAWAQKFDPANTVERPFNGGDAEPMMCRLDDFLYGEDEVCQSVCLPYGNGAYEMTVLLPREGKTVADVLERMSGNNWRPACSSCQVDLSLPRFETETDLSLNGVMAALGMPTAFDPQQAEFPTFCNVSVYIGMMRQSAKIRLDEEGTEAAAVTAIALPASTPKSYTFCADRPFLYVISEQSTGTIFFIGQFMGSNATKADAPTVRPAAHKGVVYNLNGQRISKPQSHGIYVSGGRKIVK